ncbi:MAG: primase-helicase family protein [Bacteroidota bacterium]
MSDKTIKFYKNDIKELWEQTDGGRLIFEEIYPQSKSSFEGKKNFSVRDDDEKASACVFKDKSGTVWLLQDKGGPDNKAMNAVQLFMSKNGSSFPEAMASLWQKYGNDNASPDSSVMHPKPRIENTGIKYEEIQVFTKKDFSESELNTLGPDVKAEHCNDLNLFAVDYYITKEGFKIYSTGECPIYYYDYGSFGKIYQPLNKEYRFIYKGKKPSNYIFSDKRTAKLINKLQSNVAIDNSNSSLDENTDPADGARTLPDVIICSGGSDAINLYSQGWRVIWFNSETASISDYEYKSVLRKLVGSDGHIYIVPDLDQTGVRSALQLAMRFLDLCIIWLPSRLKEFKDWKGKSCKDVRDFFKYYTDEKYKNRAYHFKLLVNTSFPMQFWIPKRDKKGIIIDGAFEINNDRLYKFLEANGFFTVETKANKNLFTWVHVKDNIVTEIGDAQIAEYVNKFVTNFFRENLQYLSSAGEGILNTIHRTNQLKVSSLSKLNRLKIDTVCWGPDHDFLFFQNFAVKVTGSGIEAIPWKSFDKYIYDYKIIAADYKPIPAPFTISFNPEYLKLKKELEAARAANTSISDAGGDGREVSGHSVTSAGTNARHAHRPSQSELQQKLDAWPELDRFTLEIHDKEFSLIKYFYNTGRVFWQKEESGQALSENERKECDLHFISKVAALGYALYRYKEQGMPYGIYAMETDESIDTGKHQGGTGKSFFLKLVRQVRKNVVMIDGQKKSIVDDAHLFGRVLEYITDFIFIDDLGKHVPLNIVFVPITGDMIVEPKFIESYEIPFEKSPKIGFTSNHPLSSFDPSMRRRIWFVGFSSYYHPEDPMKGWPERNMRTEFGKNLISDYTHDEMNKMYNFLAQCLHTYLKFHEKINPPMESIDKRNIQGAMSDDFLEWAEDYFTHDRLNVNLPRAEAIEDYKASIPANEAKFIKSKKFRERLKLYALYKGYTFNPVDLMHTETERNRNDIRATIDSKTVYYFHLRTPNFKPTLSPAEGSSHSP